ncbi:MAG TPA: ornithine cyclodeaminase family protein [Blastocatellia bacterium]|nr:ornithine cyclodeaminase family protein [Blastocatellia bacterium]
MTLVLTEHEVRTLLTMEMALEAVESAFRQLDRGQATNTPRHRVRIPGCTLHVMSGALVAQRILGLKAYTVTREGARFVVLLYDGEGGELLALMEADALGQMRTGAASGVATKYMARADAATVGILGTGWQARSQLEAVCAVRPIRQVLAFSRRPERCRAFCSEMSERLQVTVHPAAGPEEVVRSADILITATTSREPVFKGEWLSPGVHINAIGGNALIRREVDEETLRRADRIVVDSRDQAKIECGEFLVAIEKGILCWEAIHELAEVVSGRLPGREDASQITLFKSLGIAIEDVAVGLRVYERAIRENVGAHLPS